MKRKEILCDSSAIISLSDSCLDSIFHFINRNYGVTFVIPPSVEEETVTRPLSMQNKIYGFSAIKIKNMITANTIIKLNTDVKRQTAEILRLANDLFYVRGKPLHLIHEGEAEMIALANELRIETILIDERTTRMLIEAPFRIKEHLEAELDVNLMVNKEALRSFTDITKQMVVIRSSELLSVAYEKGFMDNFGDLKRQAFELALYHLKFSGCGIRFDEITEIVRSIKQ